MSAQPPRFIKTPNLEVIPQPVPPQLPKYTPTEENELPDLASFDSSATQNSPGFQSMSILKIHQNSYINFVFHRGQGYFQDREHVAGFVSHQFTKMPNAKIHWNHTKEYSNKWNIARLELVSLLKHPTPRVYMSENLPRMEDLKNATTRQLDTFEEQSLKRLVLGSDLETVQHSEKLRMFGALRAMKQCQKCHAVERGHLLGAFSYLILPDADVQK